jgi:hypothetical protein
MSLAELIFSVMVFEWHHRDGICGTSGWWAPALCSKRRCPRNHLVLLCEQKYRHSEGLGLNPTPFNPVQLRNRNPILRQAALVL